MIKVLAWILRRVSASAFALAQNASYATYLLERKASAERNNDTNRNLFEPNI
jgi:hypothetical protein